MPRPIRLAQLLLMVTFFFTTTGEAAKQANRLPDLVLLADGTFILNKSITYSSNSNRTHKYSIPVPRGFVTDLASIPWLAQLFVPKTDAHSNPAIFHDYLYWEQPCSREEADALFLLEMEDAQVGSLRRWFISTGLALGGWMAWDENKEKREQGYIRVIPRLKIPCRRLDIPCNPNIRWEKLQQQLYDEGERRTPLSTNGEPPAFCVAGTVGKDTVE